MGKWPLFVVEKLEMALQDSAEDAWLLGAILLMVWGGLRWSDVQRLQFSGTAGAWHADRQRSSLTGMCFTRKIHVWTASNCVVTAAVLRACRMPLALWRLWCVDTPFS